MGQKDIWRRLHEAPPLCQTRRWRLLWGGCRRRPGCRCQRRSARVTTCGHLTSRPRTTVWHQNDLQECPGAETQKPKVYILWCWLMSFDDLISVWRNYLTPLIIAGHIWILKSATFLHLNQTKLAHRFVCCWRDKVVGLPAPVPGWRRPQVWWRARGKGFPRSLSALHPDRPPTVRPVLTRSHTRGATSHPAETGAASPPAGV